MLSWRWILFLNLPITLFACFMTWREIHQPPVETEDDRIDYAGVVTISIGLVALLVALDQAPDDGWGAPIVLGCFAVAHRLALGVRRGRAPRGRHGAGPP